MSSKDRRKEIATTILRQMGGTNRLSTMTGAHTFVILSEGQGGVQFSIKNRKGPNRVEITLNGKDLYDVTFRRVWGTKHKVVSEHTDVYADQLRSLFEDETGMYLSFS